MPPEICGTCSLPGTFGEAGRSPGISVKLGDGNCLRCSDIAKANLLKVDATWSGTAEEMAEWEAVLLRLMPECPCRPTIPSMTGSGVVTTAVVCSTHSAALHNQRWLDGLVFMRRQRECLLREEGDAEKWPKWIVEMLTP